MTVYAISYDLQEPGQDYDDVHSAIEELGPSFDALESTWFVDVTNMSAGEVRDEITDAADGNDGIVVTEVSSSGIGKWAYTGIDGDLGDWFSEHL